MIRVSEIASELSKAGPEFQQAWDEYVNWMTREGKPRSNGTDALTIAMFLNESYRSQQTSCFPRFFASLERLLIDGEPDTKTMVEQILKQLAMSLITRMNAAERYVSWMGPETKRLSEKVWKEVLAKRVRP